jgi:hypothetical protein
MRYRLAALVAVAGIATGAALAVATPVTPQPGAVVTTSHPLFTWTLPANEQSDALYIADTPHTTPEGKFYDENVVDLGIFTNNERQWSPPSPLYAGAYWWLVWSHDANTFQSYYSAPTAFTIPAALTLLPVKTHRYLNLHWLDVSVRWRANVHGLTAKVRLLRRGRTLWARSESEDNLIGSPGSTTFTWYRPRRIKQGTRLTLRVSLLASGAKKTRAFVVRAPPRRSARRPTSS